MKATKTKAAKIVKAIRPLVDLLLLATVAAKLERERVDAIERRVLTEGNYYGRKHDGSDYRVTEPSDSWHMDELSSDAYFARLKNIHLANGYEEAASGKCPALVAEHDKLKAEWALIDAAEEFFPGTTNDRLMLGTDEKLGLECREEYLDLLCRMVTTLSGYEAPKLPEVTNATN